MELINKWPTENESIFGIISIIVVIIISFLFGIKGILALGGMVVLFVLPFYLIMSNLDLDTEESIILSLFLGIAFFALFVWYMNRLIPSLKWSVIIVSLVLYGIGIIWRKRG